MKEITGSHAPHLWLYVILIIEKHPKLSNDVCKSCYATFIKIGFIDTLTKQMYSYT